MVEWIGEPAQHDWLAAYDVAAMNTVQARASSHPLAWDGDVSFDASSHKYTVTVKTPSGEVKQMSPELSVTGVVTQVCGAFKPDEVIRKNFANWSHNPQSKYYTIIVNAGHGSESVTAARTAACEAIKDTWNTARLEGTAVHQLIEVVKCPYHRVHYIDLLHNFLFTTLMFADPK